MSYTRIKGRNKMDITELRTAGTTFFNQLGKWSYDRWEELNDRYFDGQLEVGPILFGLTPHGHYLGAYSPMDNQIVLHTSLIEPKSENPWLIGSLLGRRFAEDVLLHEMIHQYIRQNGYKGKESHNCAEWCDQIVRISKLMGVEIKVQPVKQKRIRQAGQKSGNGKVTWHVEEGHLNRKEISSFPHSIRPVGFYEDGTKGLQKGV